MGLFDMFQESEESKARKEAEYQEQLRMLERRRNPEAMEAYEAEVRARRAEFTQKDAELIELQKGADGQDQLEAWKKLQEEGKIQRSDTMERERGEQSLGGEGLIAERIDTKLPYVDSGYVDESSQLPEIELPDVGAALGDLKKGFDSLFGGGEKK